MKKLKSIHFYAFTLIELLVSMTIFFVVVMVTYIPYNYYQNKAKLRQSTKEISQSLYEARNMAINWTSSGSNLSVWLYFDSSDSSKNSLSFLSYPYSFTWSQITNNIWWQVNLIKTIELQPWIEINTVNWEPNWLFFFEAINGKWKYYYWDSSWIRNDIVSREIDLGFSYKNSSSPNLKKEIKYYTETNIVDY